jgi:hypothetical protein
MVKNIPNKMSDRHLLDFINDVCPRKIDFLYLRMCVRRDALCSPLTPGSHAGTSRTGVTWDMVRGFGNVVFCSVVDDACSLCEFHPRGGSPALCKDEARHKVVRVRREPRLASCGADYTCRNLFSSEKVLGMSYANCAFRLPIILYPMVAYHFASFVHRSVSQCGRCRCAF